MNYQATLAEFEPEGMAGPDAGLQERRSAETRIAILEAAISCLANHGYAKTTTLLVAKMARASRGAMLHHYPTRQALIESTTEYAFYKRMKAFIESVRSLTDEQRVEQNLGLRIEVESYLTVEYKAYLELHVAARTDEELRESFLPRARQYDQVWREEVRRAFPEWQQAGPMFAPACDLTRSTLEGLLLNRDIWNDPEAEDRVVDLLSRILLMIRDGQIGLSAPAKAEAGKGRRAASPKPATGRRATAR